MKARAGRSRGSGTERRWLATALLLTLTALFAGVQFIFNTTGGTLFVFATVAPALVIVSIAILTGVLFRDFRRRHSLFEIERYEPGEVFFRQGAPGDCAYFIRSGEVEVIDESGGAGDVIARLGAGRYFGETALLSNAPRNATVRAAASTEVAILGKENFLTLLSLLPPAQEDVLRTVQERAMQAARG